jgi:transcriptional regulator with XRE-family HTH domain
MARWKVNPVKSHCLADRRDQLSFMVNLVELSARIKKLRISQGLTLEQLAGRAGIAKGMLSKIENFRVTPSLPTLVKLSDALGTTISSLFDGLDHSPAVSVTRRADRLEVDRDRELSNIRYQSLAHERPNRRMDPFELIVPAKGGRDKALAHQGEEFLTVLKGRVTLEIGEEVLALEAGDSVYFNAEIPHRLINDHTVEAKVLCVFLDS